MSDSGPWHQDDPAHAGREWYIHRLEQALSRLTSEIHRRERRRSRSPKRVIRALAAFARQVRIVANRPQCPRPRSLGAFYDSGCLLTSQSNLLRHFGVRIGRREPSPPVLLDALQDEELVTLTGYCFLPGCDFLSYLTHGCIQLAGFEDHGRGGVHPSRSAILKRRDWRGFAALVNTYSHEVHANSYDTHWILVIDSVGHKRITNWIMQDPSEERSDGGEFLLPHYKRVFQVFGYRYVAGQRKRRRKRT